MNYSELISSITALACLIADETSLEDLSILALIFTQLGDTLATIALTKNKE